MNNNFLKDFQKINENITLNNNNTNNNFNEKKEVLKFLSQIGVDIRFISYYDLENNTTNVKNNKESNNKIFINNLRFSKFSRKKEKVFNHKFPEIEVIRSSLFQKIAIKSSKILSEELKVKESILIQFNDKNKYYESILAYILLEPYERKYGIKIVNDFNNKLYDMDNKENNIKFNGIVSIINLNEKVKSYLEDIFSGNSIINQFNDKNNIYNKNDDFNINKQVNNIKIIYPLLMIDKNQIKDFINEFIINSNINKNNINKNNNLNNDKKYNENKKLYEHNQISNDFMDFIEDINPQFKENILKSVEYLKNNNYHKN
ncbi:MAG: hypothetical protein LBM96_12655 [Methanobrevibacter sp.]|jgi:hypothetical protein|nr:hypothetical protein [Candidatus Methanoflexus mossambicus]